MTDHREQLKRLYLDAADWEVFHMIGVGILSSASVAIAFWQYAGDVVLPMLLFCLLCWMALLLNRALKPLLVDVFNQFHYREKFALFLVHIVLLMVPWFLGYEGWLYGLCLVLGLLCLESSTPVFYGRLYAMCAFLVIPKLLVGDLPPTALVAVWTLALLVSIRADYVRFRLERHARGKGITARDAVRESLPSVLIPWGAGMFAYLAVAIFWGDARKVLQFEAGIIQGDVSEMGPVTVTEVIFDAAILVVLIVGALAALNWIEQKLRRRKKTQALEEEELGTIAEERKPRTPPEEEADETLTSTDPRGRIVERFLRFARSLTKAGAGRGEGETAREYFGRLKTLLSNGSVESIEAPRLFNRACYSRLEISEKDARTFFEEVDNLEPRIQEGLRERNEGETKS